MGLTLLYRASLSSKFWDYVFESAVFMINHLPTKSLTFKTPYELVYGHKPNYSFLRVFGCLCFPYLHQYSHHKFEPRSDHVFFLVIPLIMMVIDALILSLVVFSSIPKWSLMKIPFPTNLHRPFYQPMDHLHLGAHSFKVMSLILLLLLIHQYLLSHFLHLFLIQLITLALIRVLLVLLLQTP